MARPHYDPLIMRVLVVGGSGAVGAVYSYHLMRGGATVSLFVRQKYADEIVASGGVLNLYNMGSVFTPRSRIVSAAPFREFELCTRPEQVAEGEFDQVWLCISSPALRADNGRWLQEFCDHLPPDCLLVNMAPGRTDGEFIRQYFPAPRPLVIGQIGFIAWQAPLPDEKWHRTPEGETGIAYQIPLGPKSLFQGEAEVVDPIVQTLRRGGLPARRAKGPSLDGAGKDVLLPLFVLALETAGYSFQRFRQQPEYARVLVGAVREALLLFAVQHGRTRSWMAPLLCAWPVRIGTWFAPRLFNYDLEAYLRYHFGSKVQTQMHAMLAELIADGEQHGCQVDRLRELQQMLREPSERNASA